MLLGSITFVISQKEAPRNQTGVMTRRARFVLITQDKIWKTSEIVGAGCRDKIDKSRSFVVQQSFMNWLCTGIKPHKQKRVEWIVD